MPEIVASLSALQMLDDLGHALRDAFFMFWETLWPLVLGFGLSGAVQAFISRDQMERVLGDHRPATLLRAGAFGMASSSCSYAASAMAKSLFQKGADFLSAMVFMVASTNLVIELGIVLAVLIGWQFTAAEFVGGPIMIVLLAVLGSFTLRPVMVEAARRRLNSAGPGRAVSTELGGMAGSGSEDWRRKITSRAAWSDSASFTVADLTMLRKELVVGYVVAGFLATLVPRGFWNALFIHGHGIWTSIENAIVGPVIAFMSFVCSIGNVPLAAALWKGGISFGGVVSFIFADLVAAPLVLIYRRYYGGLLTVRLVILFWAVMAAAGLIVEAIFSVSGLVPAHRPVRIVTPSFHWGSTSILNLVFLAVFACLYWMYRTRGRLGTSGTFALDPVCGMQVRVADAPAHRWHRGRDWWFCSDRCAERFGSDPGRYVQTSAMFDAVQKHQDADGDEGEEISMAIDPVCGMSVDPAAAAAIRRHEGRNYFFCAPGCAEAFEADPQRYLEHDEHSTER
jgi:YHS domain-containing protein/uncharacterized membrane protein YraQ (UPF0718 family)